MTPHPIFWALMRKLMNQTNLYFICLILLLGCKSKSDNKNRTKPNDVINEVSSLKDVPVITGGHFLDYNDSVAVNYEVIFDPLDKNMNYFFTVINLESNENRYNVEIIKKNTSHNVSYTLDSICIYVDSMYNFYESEQIKSQFLDWDDSTLNFPFWDQYRKFNRIEDVRKLKNSVLRVYLSSPQSYITYGDFHKDYGLLRMIHYSSDDTIFDIKIKNIACTEGTYNLNDGLCDY